MQNLQWDKIELWIVSLGLPIIAGFSLYYFQAAYSPLLDSDQAIWIHIARDPHFPDALYFYGQNRLGSLLPLTAHLLVLLGMPAIWAVSILNLAFQCTAAVLCHRISKSGVASLIVALILMFPPWTMYTISLIGHPYSTQLLLWFVIVYYLNQREELNNRSAFVLSALSLLSLWVSSLSILFVPILAYAIWFHFGQRKGSFWLRLAVSFLIGMSLIIFVKSKLRGSGSTFINIASPEGIAANFKGFLKIILYYWHQNIGIQILIVLLLIILLSLWVFGRSTLATRLTLAYGLMALIFTHLSRWVTVNDSGIRYWAFPVALLIFSALMQKGKFVKLASVPVLAIILWAGIDSTKFLDSGYRHVPDRPSRSEMEFISQRIDGKVMADYWSMYPLKIFNYNLKVSNPEPWLARDYWYWQEVMDADTIWSVNIETEAVWIMNSDTLLATPQPIIFVGESAARQYYRP